jgi:hypothetical protein
VNEPLASFIVESTSSDTNTPAPTGRSEKPSAACLTNSRADHPRTRGVAALNVSPWTYKGQNEPA